VHGQVLALACPARLCSGACLAVRRISSSICEIVVPGETEVTASASHRREEGRVAAAAFGRLVVQPPGKVAGAVGGGAHERPRQLRSPPSCKWSQDGVDL